MSSFHADLPAASSSRLPAPDNDAPTRTRFLRACDRCRRRKVKCDTNLPCSRCKNGKHECTFLNPDTGRFVSHEPAVSPRSSSTPQEAQGLERKRKSGIGEVQREDAFISDVSTPHNAYLDPRDTYHVFTARDGLPRLAGSTTGLPLLDVTRKQLKTQKISTSARDDETQWNWLVSLVDDGDEDGSQDRGQGSERVLQGGSAGTMRDSGSGDDTDVEYFPDRVITPTAPANDLFSEVTDIIPLDLQASLCTIFFQTIHPIWPILHQTRFLSEIVQWRDPSITALLVVVCMLASRYSKDPRVGTGQDGDGSASVRYLDLFRRLRLRATDHDDVCYSTQSMFFLSLFHCVDHTPHPLGQVAFAEAVAKGLDAGLHRTLSSYNCNDQVENEIRVRTAWACYCLDKQLATICGHAAMLNLWNYDIRLPAPFPEESNAEGTMAWEREHDRRHVESFVRLIYGSGVLEKAFNACHHRPFFENAPFLTRLSRKILFIPEVSDELALGDAESALEEWAEDMPQSMRGPPERRRRDPEYSLSSENVLALKIMTTMILASRRLQLATAVNSHHLHTKEHRDKLRTNLLGAARGMILLHVHMGATGLLAQCSTSYYILLSGRLTIACHLSAKADDDTSLLSKTQATIRACSLLLWRVAWGLPIAQGAAEVFDETCRVCEISLPPQRVHQSSLSPQIWYRPLSRINKASGKALDNAPNVSFSPWALMPSPTHKPQDQRFSDAPFPLDLSQHTNLVSPTLESLDAEFRPPDSAALEPSFASYVRSANLSGRASSDDPVSSWVQSTGIPEGSNSSMLDGSAQVNAEGTGDGNGSTVDFAWWLQQVSGDVPSWV